MRVLIIGELGGQVGTASKIARNRGAKVWHVMDGDSAMELLRGGNGADVVMMDVKLDIKRFITNLEQEHIHVPVIGCGHNASSEDAVRAIKSGAKEYLPLPPDEELIAAVLTAISDDGFSLIYDSEAMRQTIEMAKQIAPSDASVLITGESGTGKEVIARTVHNLSPRKDKAFISVNCAAIPENLLESELFGHEKGAFTGAVARRIGKFEEANGGTLLLDEISEMDIRLQAKLLRAIQEKVIDRVGGTKPVPVDIRILATSNRDLNQAVAEGIFRQDLLFRLNVIQLQLPPLRERKPDIPLLADHFCEHYSQANGVALRPLSKEAKDKMLDYHWPGNVRELENTMHRAVLLAQGDDISADVIYLQEPPAAASQPTMTATATAPTATAAASGMNNMVGKTVADVEKDLIISTLDHCLGNRTRAAEILGISIRTLRNKLRQYSDEGLAVPPARDSMR